MESLVLAVRLDRYREGRGAPNLPCVDDADVVRGALYRVVLQAGKGPGDLARAVVGAGMELIEMSSERCDLERVFFDLIGAGGTHQWA